MAKITRLEVENTDVKAKYNEAMNEVMKLRAELKSRIEERDDAIAELKAEVMKLRDNNEMIKQPTQDISPEEIVNVPSSVDNASEVSSKSKIQFSYMSKQKTLEDKETDAFL
ncbi:6304_t:CDS:2, partial [Acaulospora morrowiae]